MLIQAAYSYEGIGLVLPLRRAMKKPTHFSFVLDMGYVAVFFFYLIIGVLGYIGFGPCTRPEITLNLPDSIIGDSVKLLMVRIASINSLTSLRVRCGMML